MKIYLITTPPLRKKFLVIANSKSSARKLLFGDYSKKVKMRVNELGLSKETRERVVIQ